MRALVFTPCSMWTTRSRTDAPMADPQRFRNYVDGTTIKLHPVTGAAFVVPSNNVNSVFGRTGDVVATLADYAASLVTNDSSVVGATVMDALNALQAEITLDASVIKVLFSFATPSPLILGAFGPGDVVDSAQIVVLTTFAPGAHARLGISGNPSELLDVALDVAGSQFITEQLTLFGIPDVLQLEHDPSLTGTAILVYEVI
jgi:hypothetical protein